MATQGTIGAGSRLGSVAAVIAYLVVGAVTAPLWVPSVALADLLRAHRRLPLLRLGLFGLWWAALEVVGVTAAALLWVTGQSRNLGLHYRLQRWWAARLWSGITTLVGADLEVEGLDRLRPGPVIVLGRHVSLADSLVTAVLLTSRAGYRPRMVMKAELEIDPCLGIVGNRVPNVFVDRADAESTGGLVAIGHLGVGLGPDDAVVIFPEGTRANDAKRARALEAISARDRGRAEKMSVLRHLLPPRPAGAKAILDHAPGVDVVTIAHVGLDGLDSFAGIVAGLARGPLRLRYVVTRWARSEVPDGAALREWLDDRWLEMDDLVAELTTGLNAR